MITVDDYIHNRSILPPDEELDDHGQQVPRVVLEPQFAVQGRRPACEERRKLLVLLDVLERVLFVR